MQRFVIFCCVVLLIFSMLFIRVTAEPTREIIINLPEFKLYLYQNNVPIREYPISIGNIVKPSQLGVTEIINRVIEPTYYPPRWWEKDLEPIPPGDDNPVGTRWLGLGFPGYGIHGTNNPDTIGQAVSSGCIRMYNKDVEELTDLISIGTPVHLIYQTIILTQDPLRNTRTITVNPDIYRKGVNTLSNLKNTLELKEWHNAYYPALYEILSKPSYTPRPLPQEVDLVVDNRELDSVAVQVGNINYVPLKEFTILDENQNFQDTKIWDDLYVNSKELAKTFGLGLITDEQVEFFRVTIVVEGQPIRTKGFLADNDLYFPVKELTNELGLPFSEYQEESTDYLSIRMMEKLGVIVNWEFPMKQAMLDVPEAYLDDLYLGEVLMKEEERLLVPVNKLADLNIEMEFIKDENILLFQGTYGVEVVLAGDKIFVSDWVIDWLMPGSNIKILYSAEKGT